MELLAQWSPPVLRTPVPARLQDLDACRAVHDTRLALSIGVKDFDVWLRLRASASTLFGDFGASYTKKLATIPLDLGPYRLFGRCWQLTPLSPPPPPGPPPPVGSFRCNPVPRLPQATCDYKIKDDPQQCGSKALCNNELYPKCQQKECNSRRVQSGFTSWLTGEPVSGSQSCFDCNRDRYVECGGCWKCSSWGANNDCCW